LPARSPPSRVTDEPGPVPAGACGDVRRSCEICLRNKSGCHHLSWPESQCSQTSVRLDALRKSVGRASLSVRSRSSRARWQRISSAENIRRTSETNEEAPWRKPDAQWRRWRNSSVLYRSQRTPAAGTQRRRALLARVQVGQYRSLGIGDWPILKNRGPSVFSTSSISRQLFERHDEISVPMAAQPVRLPQRPALALFWATKSAEWLISSSLARFGLQRGSRWRRSSEVAHRWKPESFSHPLSGSASAWFS
jgi:hypothetical protein